MTVAEGYMTISVMKATEEGFCNLLYAASFRNGLPIRVFFNVTIILIKAQNKVHVQFSKPL